MEKFKDFLAHTIVWGFCLSCVGIVLSLFYSILTPSDYILLLIVVGVTGLIAALMWALERLT